jgi:Leucine-rich repeat (LRR) protein
MSSEELSQDEFNQDATNKEMLLEIFYNSKGSIDDINAAIDAKLFGNRTRSITVFEKFIRARIILNPKMLRLAGMEIAPLEAFYLGQYPGIEGVEELDLRKNNLGDEGLEALLESNLLDHLRVLDLRGCQISRKGMELFLKTDKLAMLERLDLRSNRIGKAWENKLKASGKYPNLSYLKTV